MAKYKKIRMSRTNYVQTLIDLMDRFVTNKMPQNTKELWQAITFLNDLANRLQYFFELLPNDDFIFFEKKSLRSSF
jgi:hypothetical protein